MPHSPSGASARPSPHVLIKSLELSALHPARIRDMARLNGTRSRKPPSPPKRDGRDKPGHDSLVLHMTTTVARLACDQPTARRLAPYLRESLDPESTACAAFEGE